MKVMKVSKVGDSVLDPAVETKDLLFYSEHNTMKIFIDQKDTVANTDTLTLPHGLTYIPIFIAFAKVSDGRWYPIDNRAFSPPNLDINGRINATNLLVTNDTGGSIDVRSFIFIDRLV